MFISKKVSDCTLHLQFKKCDLFRGKCEKVERKKLPIQLNYAKKKHLCADEDKYDLGNPKMLLK